MNLINEIDSMYNYIILFSGKNYHLYKLMNNQNIKKNDWKIKHVDNNGKEYTILYLREVSNLSYNCTNYIRKKPVVANKVEQLELWNENADEYKGVS